MGAPFRRRSMHNPRQFGFGLAVLAFVFVLLASGGAQQPAPSDPLDALHWRHIGPVGNRVAAVAGVPGAPNVHYAGPASGGLWKWTDAGTYRGRNFDGQPGTPIGRSHA